MAERDGEFKHRSLGLPETLAERRSKPGSQERERFGKVGDHFMGRFTRPATGSDENAQPNPGRDRVM
jgi:hypothetical protein